MGLNIYSEATVFEQVLGEFRTGGFTGTDLLIHLRRLLASGASPVAMLESLHRLDRLDPLPANVRSEVFRVINDAIRRNDGTKPLPAAAVSRSPNPVPRPQSPLRASSNSTRTAVEHPSVFERLLESYQAGGFDFADVLVLLRRLLSTGTAPAELAEILRRRELIEPLQEEARTQIAGILDDAQARAARESASNAGGPREQPDSVRRDDTEPVHAPAAQRQEGAASGRVAEQAAALEAQHLHTAELQRETVRLKAESAALRDALAAHEATAVQLRSTLTEREARIAEFDQEKARLLSALEAGAQKCAQQDKDLAALGARADSLKAALKASQNVASELEARRKRDESHLNAVRSKLRAAERQSGSFLELLRSREWRRGFDQNVVAGSTGGAVKVGTQAVHSRRGGTLLAGSLVRGFALVAGALACVVIARVGTRHAPPPVIAAVHVAVALPEPGATLHDCATCPTMTVLPAGRFEQGSGADEAGATSFEQPAHAVALSRSIAVSTNTVTVAEFRAFAAASGRDMLGCEVYDGEWTRGAANGWNNPGFPQTDRHPVTCTSWNDAHEYAQWLSRTTGQRYRLPSASEWEYAARAGSESATPWGPQAASACDHANVADQSASSRYPGWEVFACNDGYVYTAPVGSFKANSFGLDDMSGNLFQWTEDCWHDDYVGAPVDGSARTDGDCSEHELRGGSWFSAPGYARSAARNHFAADYRTSSVGIRVVRELP